MHKQTQYDIYSKQKEFSHSRTEEKSHKNNLRPKADQTQAHIQTTSKCGNGSSILHQLLRFSFLINPYDWTQWNGTPLKGSTLKPFELLQKTFNRGRADWAFHREQTDFPLDYGCHSLGHHCWRKSGSLELLQISEENSLKILTLREETPDFLWALTIANTKLVDK